MAWKKVRTVVKGKYPIVGEKIYSALMDLMPDANIRSVYKRRGWNGYGWYFRLHAENPTYLGKNEREALATIARMAPV